MKNIKAKFKINPFTYIFLLSALCSGFIKHVCIILMIVIIHELGHIFFIKRYEYEVEQLEIFPFGGITKVNKPINTPIKKEIIIAMGGVFFQFLLYLIFLFLMQKGMIRENTYQIFTTYNKAIFFFNLLPIIPLDGSILFHSILEYIFPFEKAYRIFFLGTLFFLLGFLILHTLQSLNNYMILSFLIFEGWETYKKRKYYINRFYLERYLYEFPYQKIKSHTNIDITELKKDTLHFFWKKDRYLHEKEFLKYRYLNKTKEIQ